MNKAETGGKTDQAKIAISQEEWRNKLTPEQFYVTRKHGTERAIPNKEKDAGMYRCVCCGAPVFSSETKFDSGTGWPNFYAPANRGAVSEHDDRSFFMRRIEVCCAKCDAHLGPRLSGWTEADGCALLHQWCHLAARQGCQARQGQQVTPKHE